MNLVSAIVFGFAIVGLLFARKHWWGWLASAVSYIIWAMQMVSLHDWVYVVMGVLLASIQFRNAFLAGGKK